MENPTGSRIWADEYPYSLGVKRAWDSGLRCPTRPSESAREFMKDRERLDPFLVHFLQEVLAEEEIETTGSVLVKRIRLSSEETSRDLVIMASEPSIFRTTPPCRCRRRPLQLKAIIGLAGWILNRTETGQSFLAEPIAAVCQASREPDHERGTDRTTPTSPLEPRYDEMTVQL